MQVARHCMWKPTLGALNLRTGSLSYDRGSLQGIPVPPTLILYHYSPATSTLKGELRNHFIHIDSKKCENVNYL